MRVQSSFRLRKGGLGWENLSSIDEMRLGFETAYVNGNIAFNLAYKPQFISNNYKEGKNVLSSIEE